MSRYFSSLIPIGRGIDLGLLLSLLNLVSTLFIKERCVIIIDLLDLFLIISTPKNSFISPKLVISNLEVVLRVLYRLLTKSIFAANTSISSTCVASIIGLLVCIKILVSILIALNPISSNILVRNNCHCLLAYFKL